ncbi:hypothetical protein PSACC_01378 [Paramicrosporidium saccamoebae]|uniref:HotDog ACOT-type domain-containing protein n=1 Tax=Paramicrosporidium saccamoebae TaxID=1246581 RepID=A0A2H9TMB0_9FUNG|nr:hypothetical protein PSACC_01378 [Paramicrosporidium saccamoebae]
MLTRRWFSGKTPSAFLAGALQYTAGAPSSSRSLVQVRVRRPARSHLMSVIWRHRMRTATSPTSVHIVREKTTVHGEKRISDSFCEVLLPFRTETTLLEEYASMHGGLRFGKLLEDLDALAASIAYLHCDDAGLTLVTAAVDRIDLLKQFDSVVSDIRMRGFVTYVGTSSMEVTMAVDMDEANGWELAALAKFVFVARSQDGSTAVKVPRLVLETAREQEIYDLGKARHKYRLSRSAQSLFHQPPTETESMILHRLLMRPDSDAHVWPMRSTELTSLRICHPQERNIHNFIFGGYLMREAFELAYSTVALFTRGAALTVTTVDDVTFVHPVAIGSMLSFCARIVYTDQCPTMADQQRLHVEVVADVIDPKNGTRVTTNTFHYTFTRPTTDFVTVVPETYTEAMRYLEGKRRVESKQD